MDDKKRRNVGTDIQDMVKDAVSSMDFKRLNNEITISVNNALAEVRSALGMQGDGDRLRGDAAKPGTWRPAAPGQQEQAGMPQPQQHPQPQGQQAVYGRQGEHGNQVNPNVRNGRQGMAQNPQGRSQARPINNNRQALQGNTANEGSGWLSWNQQGNQAPNARNAQANRPGQQLRRGIRIPYVPKGRAAGTVAAVLGTISVTGFSISMLVFFILAVTLEIEVFATLFASFFLPLAAGLILVKSGKKLRARTRRMNVYLKQLQYRGFSSIKELSSAVGESERFVLKDIKKMLSLGMFPEGYIDQSGTCFIGTRENYEQYAIAQKGYELRIHEENRRLIEEQERLLRQNHQLKAQYEKQIPVSDEPYGGLPPEIREAVISGRGQIKLIKEANEAIEGEVMSAKLDRLELVIDRILYHVEKHPEKLPEIRRFMDYYLPTTLKLVMTYKDFDSQLVQGENILTAKEEIMKTLDTINFAFEKLLDSMFEEAAIDVSTDITVLETMLAQEGLTESDFSVGQAERSI